MKRIALLALGAFVVATDGTLVIGLLRQIARSLEVSVSATGQAVTIFAVVYAIGGPLLVRALRRARLERVLVAVLALFVGGNLLTAAASSLATLLIARALAAACAGVFMPLAALVAARTIAPERQARALAVVVGGASAATAIGVPLGTFIGASFGWRTAFYAVAIATALLAAGLWLALEPRDPEALRPVPPARRAQVVLTLATTLVWAAGSFTFFTYIASVLHRTAAIGASGLAFYLLLFGLGGIGGAGASGWLTDRKGPLITLTVALAIVAAALAALGTIAAFGNSDGAVLSAIAVTAYGVGTWAVTPPQQKRLIGSGQDQVLLSLNASALYGGVAAGSLLGGVLLGGADGIARLCFVAAAVEIAALVIAGASWLRSGHFSEPRWR